MTRATIDGNEAAASVAYRLNEVCCIYPITPSSPMAELADEWASQGRPNLWGSVPAVVEMQSEGGAAGALHGALQSGALATTFTASQGLLLMIPNMYKIAGELTPAVLHVAARSLAAQGLSIFGDHSDVMAVRQTGFALLASASVQEAHDLALVAQAATLAHPGAVRALLRRVPHLARAEHDRDCSPTTTCAALVPEELVRAHRGRALSPERPFIRGTAQNPDVYFQARETVNPFYAAVPGAVAGGDGRAWPSRTGRRYHLVDYAGHPEAERVIVVMGSGARDRRARPWPTCARRASGSAWSRSGCTGRSRPEALLAALPRERAAGRRARPHQGAGLDRRAALPRRGRRAGRGARRRRRARGHAAGDRRPLRPVVEGAHPGHGRRGVRRAGREQPRPPVHRSASTTTCPGPSLPYDRVAGHRAARTVRAVFFGLGSDGTVGANKNTIKILGDEEGLNAQGYFVYDSKKSGSQTVSHLRFGPEPIRAPYLVSQASFVGCHHFGLLERVDVLGRAAPGATLLLNCPHRPDEVWDALPRPVQEQILAKRIDALRDRRQPDRPRGRAGRPDQHRPADLLLRDLRACCPGRRRSTGSRRRSPRRYGRRGARGGRAQPRRRRPRAGRAAPGRGARPGDRHRGSCPPSCRTSAPEFVRTVTAAMMAGRGDDLPVSALPGGRHLPERHRGLREAEHLRAGRRAGTRTCASSAATAASSARTA